MLHACDRTLSIAVRARRRTAFAICSFRKTCGFPESIRIHAERRDFGRALQRAWRVDVSSADWGIPQKRTRTENSRRVDNKPAVLNCARSTVGGTFGKWQVDGLEKPGKFTFSCTKPSPTAMPTVLLDDLTVSDGNDAQESGLYASTIASIVTTTAFVLTFWEKRQLFVKSIQAL